MLKHIFLLKIPFVIILFGVLLISNVSCDKLNEITGKPEQLSFLNDQFSIKKPGSWTIKKDLNAEADLQVANYLKEAYLLVLCELKTEFKNITLEEHSALTRNGLKKYLEDYKESEGELLIIAGNKAVRYKITGRVKNIDLEYWHVTIETENHFNQMVFWSLASKFTDNESDFNATMMSFREKSDNVRKGNS